MDKNRIHWSVLEENSVLRGDVHRVAHFTTKKQPVKKFYEFAKALPLENVSVFASREVCPTSVVRGGVLPFFYDEHKRLTFLLGRDYRSGDLTDFGGHREEGESIVDCAFRECNEETNSFLKITKEHLQWGVTTSREAIFLVEIPLYSAWRAVGIYMPPTRDPEIFSLVTLTVSQLGILLQNMESYRSLKTEHLVKNYKIYSVIIPLLKVVLSPECLEHLRN